MPLIYPDILLPQPNYKLITCHLEDEFLIRYVNMRDDNDLLVDENGKVVLQKICSPTEHIYDLSTCLLGLYKLEFTKIEFTQDGVVEYAPYCEPNSIINSPSHPEHFNLNERRKFWGIKVRLIDGLKVKITLGEKEVEAISHVKHTPTKGNFWHYSILWIIEDVPLADYCNNDAKTIKKIAAKIGAKARAILVNFAEVEIFDCPGLDGDCYCNN